MYRITGSDQRVQYDALYLEALAILAEAYEKQGNSRAVAEFAAEVDLLSAKRAHHKVVRPIGLNLAVSYVG